MHELALARNIIAIVDSEAEKSGFKKVIEIKLSIGEFSGIVPECLREFFPIAAKGSTAENALLKVETIPVSFICLDCGYEGDADRKNHCCPSCRGTALKMKTGREFFVDSLKVE